MALKTTRFGFLTSQWAPIYLFSVEIIHLFKLNYVIFRIPFFSTFQSSEPNNMFHKFNFVCIDFKYVTRPNTISII